MTTYVPEDTLFSADAADEYDRGNIGPYVDVAERDYNYPQKFPLDNDRLHLDYKKPIFKLRPIDAGSLAETARYGFGRLGYSDKQAYAFAPAPTYVQQNIAQAYGHRGGTGPLGTFPHEDLDPRLGGGFAATLVHAPAVKTLL